MSQITSPFGSSDKEEIDLDASVSEERLLEAARTDNGAGMDIAAAAANCPRFTTKSSDRLLTIYEIGRVGDGLAIRHRGEITKTARECRISSDEVSVKYGFAGRVLLGPSGSPGTYDLPVRVYVSDRSNEVVASQTMRVSVNISEDKPIGYFSQVREISVPLPRGVPPSDYQVFVGFDSDAPGAG